MSCNLIRVALICLDSDSYCYWVGSAILYYARYYFSLIMVQTFDSFFIKLNQFMVSKSKTWGISDLSYWNNPVARGVQFSVRDRTWLDPIGFLRSVILVIFGLRSGPGLDRRSGRSKMTVAQSDRAEFLPFKRFKVFYFIFGSMDMARSCHVAWADHAILSKLSCVVRPCGYQFLTQF